MHQYLSVVHCNKMAVSDVLFHQCAVTEFLIKENSPAADICVRLHRVYGDSCVGASPV
jgi:hypothetical protein